MATYDPATRYRIKVNRVVRLADGLTVLRPDHHNIEAYGNVVSQIDAAWLVSAEPLPAVPQTIGADVKAAVESSQAASTASRSAGAKLGKASVKS